MVHPVLVVMLLVTAARADVKEGWSVGSGGKVYGDARGACDAFLKETASGGVRYMVVRLEPTAAGDQMCWHKPSHIEGEATTSTLVYRTRRLTYKGIQIFRGTTEAKRRDAATLEHDLGPGTYFHKEQWVARSYAQAGFLEAYTARGTTSVDKVPDGIVLDYDFVAPGDLFDFSSGKLLSEFEKSTCEVLAGPLAERMFDGEVNPVLYYKAFKAFIDKKYKGKKPSELKIVIGPDYRHSIAGNGQPDTFTSCAFYVDKKTKDVEPPPARRQPQIRIADAAFAAQLDKQAMKSLETRFPSADDVIASLVGHRTNALFQSCEPTAKSGSCKAWTYPAGRLMYLRRKWQSVVHHKPAKPGSNVNHYHLRIGDVIIDGTFVQFDGAAADVEEKAELFVGTRAKLIQRLDQFTKPELPGADGAKMFQEFWDTPPHQVGTPPHVERLVHKASGEVDWE